VRVANQGYVVTLRWAKTVAAGLCGRLCELICAMCAVSLEERRKVGLTVGRGRMGEGGRVRGGLSRSITSTFVVV
jgi:hypothetical protein